MERGTRALVGGDNSVVDRSRGHGSRVERVDAHLLAIPADRFKFDQAVDQRIQRVVAADADVVARMELGATLANDDAARANGVAVVELDSQSLRLAVAAVAGATDSLFMCHLCAS